MKQHNFLGNILATLFERRRPGSRSSADRSIEDMCHALLSTEGEVSGVALAQAIIDYYGRMSGAEKLSFFQFLNSELEEDLEALENSIVAYRVSGTNEDYSTIGQRAEPRRQEVLRRLPQAPGATHAIVMMRADFLNALKDDAELARTYLDLQHQLRSWFNREFVVFVGPLGSSKFTLLRLFAGLEDAASGHIQIDGKDAADLPPAKRGLATMCQSSALYFDGGQ